MDWNTAKVFSATKARDRSELGDKLTRWLRLQPAGTEVCDTIVAQSSDREFHCLSIVIFVHIPKGRVRKNKNGSDNSVDYTCEDCGKVHETTARCRECHACLYENSKQVKDDQHPLFECTKCGAVTFWD